MVRYPTAPSANKLRTSHQLNNSYAHAAFAGSGVRTTCTLPGSQTRCSQPNHNTAKDHKASAFSHGAKNFARISNSSTSNKNGTTSCQTRKHGRRPTSTQTRPNPPGKGVCAKEKTDKLSKQKALRILRKACLSNADAS